MASSPSDILTPFQEEVLRAVSARNPAFFLTGGTALAAFYLGHRRSDDLDFFTIDDAAWASVAAAAEGAARDLGAEIEWTRTAPQFRRCVLSRGADAVVADFVRDIDAQIVREKPTRDGIVVDSIEDIAANKICTLLGRQEAKDYIDVYFLAKAGIDPLAMVPLANRKDAGVNPAVLAMILDDPPIREIPRRVLRPPSLGEIRAFFQELGRRFADAAYPGRTSTPG
ncbi:MAG: nucleotidyl transferase AbiEii/AbiGii toxin family protein [Planctomycetes bacterium]|nr:nucleotidyl transferase AbiEii/AbiGii toxin family protein [Planctomycetota bacterium]